MTTPGEGAPYGSAAMWRCRIRPAFYQNTWFYAGGALVLGLLLWGAWKFRITLV